MGYRAGSIPIIIRIKLSYRIPFPAPKSLFPVPCSEVPVPCSLC
ncbi:hypothetical protein [Moorena sp. SIO4G3]|nr:hypothetical protein [Moorena sp. SIO4G3]